MCQLRNLHLLLSSACQVNVLKALLTKLLLSYSNGWGKGKRYWLEMTKQRCVAYLKMLQSLAFVGTSTSVRPVNIDKHDIRILIWALIRGVGS